MKSVNEISFIRYDFFSQVIWTKDENAKEGNCTKMSLFLSNNNMAFCDFMMQKWL